MDLTCRWTPPSPSPQNSAGGSLFASPRCWSPAIPYGSSGEEGRNVIAWLPTDPADDSNAGNTETSVMLRLRPADVALDTAEAGNTRPLPALIDQLRDGGVRQVSPNGVLGDPAGATAEHGEGLLTA